MENPMILIYSNNVPRTMKKWLMFKLPADSIKFKNSDRIVLKSGVIFKFVSGVNSLRGLRVENIVMDEWPDTEEALDAIKYMSMIYNQGK